MGVLWSRRRKRKQNKLFSIKYQSYHRHHLTRISSCHKLQRAKKTKKTKFSSKTRTASLTRSQKVIEKIIAIHSSNPSKKKKANSTKKCPIEACIQFFWKVVLLPSRIVQCEKIGPPDTASSRSRNQCRTTRNQTLISI